MKLDYLLSIMQNRVLSLTEARKAAVTTGDIERIEQIDGDLLTTESTVEQLKRALQSQ
jgi:predicted transcriptional regulator